MVGKQIACMNIIMEKGLLDFENILYLSILNKQTNVIPMQSNYLVVISAPINEQITRYKSTLVNH